MTISNIQRGPMQPVVPRMRAYFAPVARAGATPSVFDPAKNATFSLDAPPAPWIDVGWIENFERSSSTKLLPLFAGVLGAAQSQFRSFLNAQVKFNFTAWGKLQMALSSGSQHMNILAELPNAAGQPSGGAPILPAAVLPGSTAIEIAVRVRALNSFAAGDIIAVDTDYAQQVGYV